MKPKTLFFSSLIAAAAMSTVPALADAETIQISYGTNKSELKTGNGTISYSGGWNNATDNSNSTAAASTLLKNSTGTETTATTTWTSANTYMWNDASDEVLKGYLDDGSGVTVNVYNISYLVYDVTILAATDTGSVKFSAKTVNGLTYTSDGGGNGVPGSNTWGASQQTTINNNNSFTVSGLTGDLLLNSVKNSPARGCIAGLIITNATPENITAIAASLDGTASAWTMSSLAGTTWANSTTDAPQYANLTMSADTTLTLESGVITDAVWAHGSGALTLAGEDLTFQGLGILRADNGTSIVVTNTLNFTKGGTLSKNITTSGNGVLKVSGGTLNAAVLGLSGSTVNFSVESGATLDFGSTASGINQQSISGAGTVAFNSTNHGATIDFGDTFSGIVNISGNVGLDDHKFGSKDATVSVTGTTHFWSPTEGVQEIKQALKFESGSATRVSGWGSKTTTLTLSGGMTFEDDATFTVDTHNSGTAIRVDITGAITNGNITQKAGTLNISGAGENSFSALTISGGTANITAGTNTITTLSQTGGALNISASTDENATSTTITTATVSGGTLSGGNITTADVSGGTVSNATITTANLTGGTISGGNITTANVTSGTVAVSGSTISTLTQTGGALNISGSTSTTITTANLTGGALSGGTITNANVTNGTVAVSGSTISTLTQTGGALNISGSTSTTITTANLTGGALSGGTITNANVTNGTVAVSGSTISTLTQTGGALNISGSTSTTITTANVSGGALSGGNITTANVNGGTVSGATITTANLTSGTISGGTITTKAEISSTGATAATISGTTTISGTLHQGSAGTLNIGNGTDASVVSVNRMELGDIQAEGTTTLNVNQNATLAVTGSNNTTTGQQYKNASFVVSEWGNTTTTNVYGSLLAKDAKLLRGNCATTLNVSGGTLAVKGFYATANADNAVTVNVSDSGKLILGSGDVSGINTLTVSLNDGTLAASESAITFSKSIALTGAGTIDTTKYDFASDGKSITQGTSAAAITLSGGVSNDATGSLTVTGAGKLKLSGTVTNAGAIDFSGANIELANAISNTGTVTVDKSTVFVLADSLLGTNTNTKTYTLITNGADSGSITGWNSSTLTTANFRQADGTEFSGRSIANVNTAGAVTITVVAYDLFWKGGTSGTWDTTESNTVWSQDSAGSADTAFVSGDNVTFNSGESVSVEVASAGVTAGTMTVASGTTVALSGGNVTVKTLSGAGTISLSGSDNTSAFSSAPTFNNWTGTVKITDRSASAFALSNYGTSGSTIELSGFSGYFSEQANGTVAADIKLTNSSTNAYAAQITNGNSGYTMTFSGSISGDGLFYHSGPPTQIYKFTGDVSAFTGTLKSTTATFEFAGTKDQTFNGSIVGDGTTGAKITKSGSTTLTLTGTSINAAALTISGGAVNVTGSGKLTGTLSSLAAGTTLSLAGTGEKSAITLSGSTSISGNLTIGNATVDASASSDIFNYNVNQSQKITLNSGGTLALGSNRQSFNGYVSFELNGGTITGDGDTYGAMDLFGANNITVKSDSKISATIRMRSGGTGGSGGSGNVTITVDDGAVLTVAGRINKKDESNTTRQIIKSGAGSMKLTADNSYFAAGFVVNTGTLVAANTSALGTGKVSVAKDAKLGLVAGTTVSGVSGGVELASGAKLVIDMAGQTASAAQDTLTLNLVVGSALKYNGNAFDVDCTTLITEGVVVLDNLDSSLKSWVKSLSYASDTQTLTLTMTVPEPSTFGLLAGVGALAFVAARRRRRAK